MEEQFLKEAYGTTRKATGFDPCRPEDFVALIRNPEKFKVYSEGLAEGLEGRLKDHFTRCLKTHVSSLWKTRCFNSIHTKSFQCQFLETFIQDW